MAHVCYDCTLWYGHPLSWCPGCGRKMIKVKTSSDDFKKAKNAGWKYEGLDLYEHYLDGKLIDSHLRYNILYHRALELYSGAFELFGLSAQSMPKDKPSMTPDTVCWNHGDRYIKMYLEKKGKMRFTIESPFITFRLKGSNLPIEEESFAFLAEHSFKLT